MKVWEYITRAIGEPQTPASFARAIEHDIEAAETNNDAPWIGEESLDWALLRAVPGYTNFDKSAAGKLEIARANANAEIRDVQPVSVAAITPGVTPTRTPVGGLMTNPNLFSVTTAAPLPTDADVIASASWNYRAGAETANAGILEMDEGDDPFDPVWGSMVQEAALLSRGPGNGNGGDEREVIQATTTNGNGSSYAAAAAPTSPLVPLGLAAALLKLIGVF